MSEDWGFLSLNDASNGGEWERVKTEEERQSEALESIAGSPKQLVALLNERKS
jgi:hypothetical protein